MHQVRKTVIQFSELGDVIAQFTVIPAFKLISEQVLFNTLSIQIRIYILAPVDFIKTLIQYFHLSYL